jgi:hypothetical protein
MTFVASHSDFSAFEGRVSSYGTAAAQWIGERVSAVSTLFSYAKEEVVGGLESFLHIGPTTAHTEPQHRADHSFERDNDERTDMMIALRKYLASLFAFQANKPAPQAARPTQMRGRRFAPKVGHQWTHRVPEIRAAAASQLNYDN